MASDYWMKNGGVIVDNIAKYAAACHAAGRGEMDDDDSEAEARFRLTALQNSITRALDNAVTEALAAERARVVALVHDVVSDAIHDAVDSMDERDRIRDAVLAAIDEEVAPTAAGEG